MLIHLFDGEKKLLKYKNLFYVIIILVLISLSSNVYALTITKIEVKGNSRIRDGQILQNLRKSNLRVGEEYTPENAQKALRSLYSLGAFEDIQLLGEEFTSGLQLIIEVKEYPIIEKIKFRGNEKIKDKELKKEININKGSFLSPQKLSSAIEDIELLYYEKNYLQLEIETQTAPLENDSNRVWLWFDIYEGEEVKIKEIDIIGNWHFDDATILRKSNLETSEEHWWGGGDFKPEEFEADLIKIEQFYANNGYLDAKVIEWSQDYSKNNKDLYLTIIIEEEQTYYVGDISFSGNEIFETENLEKRLKIKEDEILAKNKFDLSLQNLYSAYAEEGYIYAIIIPHQSKEDSIISIKYTITEGKPAKVHKIYIVGNRKTKEKVIRRELYIKPGDLFKQSALIRSYEEIYNLGFFKSEDPAIPPIDLEHKQINEDGDIDLTFKVIEGPTGQFQAGAGYSAQDKLSGYIGISEPNLFGNAWRVDLKWDFGKIRQNVEFSFTEPWLMDTPTLVGFNIRHTSRDRYTYKETRLGGDIFLGRPTPWWDYTRVQFLYGLDRVKIDQLEGEEISTLDPIIQNAINKGPQYTSRTIFTLRRDSRDNIFNATRGSRNIISLEFAGKFLGGDIHYQKFITESAWYFQTFYKLALMLRFRTGLVEGYGDQDNIPLSERFVLGGTGEYGLRGYRDYSIFPEGDIYGVGGRSMMVITSEYKMPLVENATPSIYILAFFEAGNTWSSLEDATPSDLKKSVGLGVRILGLPTGPIGFDYGYGFDRAGGGRWEPHFQMGMFF